MTPEPHWTAYVSALLVPVVTVLGAYIAYLQWRLAQSKLKFDLFDRRMKVYEAATALLSSILTSGKAKNEEVFKFMVATREAKWLFNTAIAEYLEKQLYHKAIDLQTLDSELDGVPVGEERSKNVQSQSRLKKWFSDQYPVLDEKLGPYLQLQH